MNKEEESVTPTPSMTQEEKNDLTEVFPSFRIKSILKQEEQIGRVYGSAVDQIGTLITMMVGTNSLSACICL